MKPISASTGKKLIVTLRIPHDYKAKESIYIYGKYELVMYENCMQIFVKGVTVWLPLSEVLKIEEFKKKQKLFFKKLK